MRRNVPRWGGDGGVHPTRLRSHHELRGAAADVLHQIGAGHLHRVESVRAAKERQRRLLLPGHDLQVRARLAAHRNGECVPVRRVAHGAGGGYADPFYPKGPGATAVAGDHRQGPRHGGRIQPAGHVTPCPSRVITMSRPSSVGSSPGCAPGSTTRSRHEFVP